MPLYMVSSRDFYFFSSQSKNETIANPIAVKTKITNASFNVSKNTCMWRLLLWLFYGRSHLSWCSFYWLDG